MSLILLGILNSQVTGGGGAGAYDLLETQVLTTSASSVTFTGLGSYTDYKHLQLRMVMRNDFATGTLLDTFLQINSDTGNNYAHHFLRGDGSNVASAATSSTSSIVFPNTSPGSTSTASAFAVVIADILDFGNSSKNTTIRALSGGHVASEDWIALNSGLWNSTSAVTSITVNQDSANFVSGSRFSLYGIR